MEVPAPADEWPEETVEAARSDMQALVEAEWASIRRAEAQLEQAQRSALGARGARLLLDAALVELALGQQPDLFGEETYPSAFEEAAVIGLKRHGYPWAPLLKIAHSHIRQPRPTDPFFVQIQNKPLNRLRRQFVTLTQRAERLLQEIAAGSW